MLTTNSPVCSGGLIVIGDSQEVLGIVDGGFKLGIDYSPARLYELAKMDGAIVLSDFCQQHSPLILMKQLSLPV